MLSSLDTFIYDPEVLKHYIYRRIVTVTKHLDKKGCVALAWSGESMEQASSDAQMDAGRRHRDSVDDASRFIAHLNLNNPNPRSKRSLNLKLARKIPASNRSKKKLNSLHETLAPWSKVIRIPPNMPITKEPEKPTPLRFCAQRRLLPYNTNTVQKIVNMWKTSRINVWETKKIRRRFGNNISVVSSLNLNT